MNIAKPTASKRTPMLPKVFNNNYYSHGQPEKKEISYTSDFFSDFYKSIVGTFIHSN